LKLAEEMKEIFFEVIIAPSISDEARPIFATKKNLRVIIM
jgi:phosphoribosylaminoimidazolecarboxamide formyltransferase / IMP cyclohydrolase